MEEKLIHTVSILVGIPADERDRIKSQLMEYVHIEPYSGCWIYSGAWSARGYGRKAVRQSNGKTCNRLAHRISFELFRGEVPKGMALDHLCRTRCCVNPSHLEPVTSRENSIRGIGPQVNRLRLISITRCKFGHEYTPENTFVQKFKSGKTGRQCIKCRSDRGRIRYAREREERLRRLTQ